MKKKKLDINNLKDNQRKKDHMYSDILGGSGTTNRVTGSAKKKGTIRVENET